MKKFQRLKRAASLCLASLLLAGITAGEVHATSIPYDTYNYDYREYIHFTPAAYVPDTTIRGSAFTYNGEPLGNFVTPQDLCQADDGRIYVAVRMRRLFLC